ncbi:calcitonin gene-related peptide type 1 receptor-like isoform X2 [Ischnura elegans]|uniref:calcitonin gene-related peptide type 1 receptor-like isoform X2 n=1 Tax=Ischnura elegans TaxID=197161 RepID=UPI001ED867A7|nr:calcitonin gene-related peptide type 1 receptor-like isoform X2 [Ischnura elegans]
MPQQSQCILAVLALVVALSRVAFGEEPPAAASRWCRCREAVLPPSVFERHACALCYHYMHEFEFAPGAKWSSVVGPWPNEDQPGPTVLQLQRHNLTVVVDAADRWSPLWESFAGEEARGKWQQCCRDAVECCTRMSSNNESTASGWCPRTWDGWRCWDDAPPNTVQQTPCPAFIRIGNKPPPCALFARKSCSWDGRWSRQGVGNGTVGEEWTDYTPCAAVAPMRRRVLVSVSAYALTIAALLPALFVFAAYRQLQVPRIILHKNLFVSLLANAVCVIIFKCLVILTEFDTDDNSIVKQNGSGCKLLLILTKYFRLTNYMWMFCEGFYLHRLIAAAFAEQKSLILFYAIGWGFPVLPTALYAVLRATQADERCWAAPAGEFEWCIILPSILSLLLNAIFLINIIRVLFTKLRAAHANEPSQYRKTVRATLVLLPLFGLHFVVTAYRPSSSGRHCDWIELYFYADYLLDGLQGLLVALIFCYFNGEVHYLIKRSYFRFVEARNPSSRRSGTNDGSSRTWLTTTGGATGHRNSSATRASFVHHASLVEGSNGAHQRRDSAPGRQAQHKRDEENNGDTVL